MKVHSTMMAALLAGSGSLVLKKANHLDRVLDAEARGAVDTPPKFGRKKRRKTPGFKGLRVEVKHAPFATKKTAVRALARRIRWEKSHGFALPKGRVAFDRKMPRHIRETNAKTMQTVVSFDPPPRHPTYAPDRQGFARVPPSQRVSA